MPEFKLCKDCKFFRQSSAGKSFAYCVRRGEAFGLDLVWGDTMEPSTRTLCHDERKLTFAACGPEAHFFRAMGS